MKAWLGSMEHRERRLVIGGAAAALVIAVAGLVWWPLQAQRAELAERVESQRQTLAWMQAAGERIRSARAGDADGESAPGDGRSLLSVVDDGVRRNGFENQLRRAEPAGETGVRLWVDGVGYAALTDWLAQMERRHGIEVAELRLERAGDGLVNARILLAGAG